MGSFPPDGILVFGVARAPHGKERLAAAVRWKKMTDSSAVLKSPRIASESHWYPGAGRERRHGDSFQPRFCSSWRLTGTLNWCKNRVWCSRLDEKRHENLYPALPGIKIVFLLLYVSAVKAPRGSFANIMQPKVSSFIHPSSCPVKGHGHGHLIAQDATPQCCPPKVSHLIETVVLCWLKMMIADVLGLRCNNRVSRRVAPSVPGKYLFYCFEGQA